MAKSKLSLWLLRDPGQAEVLRRPARPVDWPVIATPEFQRLIDEMFVTMHEADGIGLAAPQIGQSIRLAVINSQATENRQPLVLINPVIEQTSPEQVSMEEGCLSIPKVFGRVPRARSLWLAAVDRDGNRYRLEAHDLFARVIQHEIDHLNGRLYIDRSTEITSGKIPV